MLHNAGRLQNEPLVEYIAPMRIFKAVLISVGTIIVVLVAAPIFITVVLLVIPSVVWDSLAPTPIDPTSNKRGNVIRPDAFWGIK